MKLQLIGLLLLLQLSAFAQGKDSVNLYFQLNNAKLETHATHTIDSIIQHHIFIPGVKMAILGYADYVGDNKYNDSLSTVRAQHVMDYLLTKGFKKEDIRLCVGKGKIDRAPVNGNAGFAADRKVTIIRDNVQKNTVAKLPEMKVNETAAIDGLFFGGGSDAILQTSFQALDNLYEVLKENPKMKIRLEGHICCVPFSYDPELVHREGFVILQTPDGKYRLDQRYNDDGTTLSLARAKAVYNFLVRKGIDASRLRYIGLGETEGEALFDKQEGMGEQHRRVDIRILEK